EMLPAHGYPQLKKYKHLKGNIGKAWYDQRRLFEKFTGAILATTNCVMPIKGSYSDRFFSYDIAGLEGVEKIENDDGTLLLTVHPIPYVLLEVLALFESMVQNHHFQFFLRPLNLQYH
ncbi:hypothetical protein ACT453_34935, partial [Bacillus sp. D-CC]